MNAIRELVDLPDPAVQPLVHPLDLPQARGAFRTSWWIGILTSPGLGLCLGALVWFAARSYVLPLLAGGALVGLGALAGRAYRDRAWDFIPRKRQDRQRPLPAAWELTSALVLAAALAVALLLASWRLGRPDIGPEVQTFAFGAGTAAGLLMVADLVSRLVRYRGDERRHALPLFPAVVVVLAALALAYGGLLGFTPAGWSPPAAWGAATMLAGGTGAGAWKLVERRRATGPRGPGRPLNQ